MLVLESWYLNYRTNLNYYYLGLFILHNEDSRNVTFKSRTMSPVHKDGLTNEFLRSTTFWAFIVHSVVSRVYSVSCKDSFV